MHIKRVGLLAGLCIAAPATQAGTLTIDTGDVSLGGGMAAGYYHSTNTGVKNQDTYQVSDILVELSHAAETGGVGFTAGFGSLAAITMQDGGVNNSTAYSTFGLQYGSIDVVPVEGLTISAGKLATMVGYEVTPSYANPHATIAAIWGGQPVYYPGLRASYDIGGVTVYAEANDDSLTLNGATANMARAVGVSGSFGSVDYVASYYNYLGAKDMVDVILSSSFGNIDVALNVDYHTLDDVAKVSGNDSSAVGAALYVTPTYGKMSYPVRIEHFSDGTSTIYGGVDSANTFTITPTYSPTEHTFIRGEVSMMKAKNKVFSDEKGVAKDSKTSYALQAGYRF